MTRDRFLEGMSHAASTVNVVTTAGSAGRAGVTVSAMCSVSADPPSLLVCVHHQSHAASVIRENGVLCVNVLRDAQSFIADTFAGRIEAPGGDKFACAEWRAGETGAPLLADALVAFDCRVGEHVRWGTHYIFVAEVLDIVLQESGPPLIYANRAYGKPVRFERLAAPDYRRGLVLLFTDAMIDLDEFADVLDRLRHRGHDVAVVWILDPDELDLGVGSVSRFEALEGDEEIVAEPRALRDAYRDVVEQHRIGMEQAALARGVTVIETDTATPPAVPINRLLVALQHQVR